MGCDGAASAKLYINVSDFDRPFFLSNYLLTKQGGYVNIIELNRQIEMLFGKILPKGRNAPNAPTHAGYG